MSSAIDCDVISRTMRHEDDVLRPLLLSSFMDSICHVRNKIMYVLEWRTVSALTQVWFLCLFPSLLRNSGNKHKNNPLVRAETVCHSITYIILYALALKSNHLWPFYVEEWSQHINTYFDGSVQDCSISCALAILHWVINLCSLKIFNMWS